MTALLQPRSRDDGIPAAGPRSADRRHRPPVPGAARDDVRPADARPEAGGRRGVRCADRPGAPGPGARGGRHRLPRLHRRIRPGQRSRRRASRRGGRGRATRPCAARPGAPRGERRPRRRARPDAAPARAARRPGRRRRAGAAARPGPGALAPPGDRRGAAPADPARIRGAIDATHATAACAEETDWARIVGWYAELEELTANPVVRLNRAVAVAEASGPQAGLELLHGLDLAGHRLPAVRAELLVRTGRSAERRYLLRRRAAVPS